MTQEAWRPIPGYEGTYSVSDLGRVRRDSGGQGARPGHIRRSCIDAGGYRRVGLCREGHERSFSVARLVAFVFLGAPEIGQEVRHLDGNSLNDCVRNLAWGTKAENERDKLIHGTHNMAKRERCPLKHPLDPPNLIPSSLKQGLRGCLACSRARSYIRTHPELATCLQEVADRYCQSLLEGVSA